MSDILTAEDIKTLKRPFPAKYTEFLNGLAYIGEALVTSRIEEIDPAWQFEIVSVQRSDGIVTALGRLQIKNVTRDNVGMAKVVPTKSGTGEANEAEKSAATDALKRCARLFGVGRYLLTLPDSVKDVVSLEKYLAPFMQPPAPANSNGTGSSNDDGSQITDGSEALQKIQHVTAVKIIQNKEKRWIDAGGVSFWTREPFTEAGYDTESWTTPGVIQLKEVPFTVLYSVNDKGFKTGVKVIPE